jgi:hypothetical protein
MRDCSTFPEWENKVGHVGLPYQEGVQGTANLNLLKLYQYLLD